MRRKKERKSIVCRGSQYVAFIAAFIICSPLLQSSPLNLLRLPEALLMKHFIVYRHRQRSAILRIRVEDDRQRDGLLDDGAQRGPKLHHVQLVVGRIDRDGRDSAFRPRRLQHANLLEVEGERHARSRLSLRRPSRSTDDDVLESLSNDRRSNRAEDDGKLN